MPYARNKSVNVVITRNANGGVDFALNENNGKGPVQKIRFENNKHPGLIVYFNIRDPDDTGLLFPPVPEDALWVAAPIGQGKSPPPCPTQASRWAGFVPLSVEQDANGNNTQLIAYYRNLKVEQCRFALRFLWPDGTAEDYDPIGDGQDGLRR